VGCVGAETQGASRHDGAVIQGGGEGSGAGFPGNNPTPRGARAYRLAPLHWGPGQQEPGLRCDAWTLATVGGSTPRNPGPREG
jgi:hypothetical protein